jgi:hypothetical protein
MSLQKIESALIGSYLGAGLNLPTQYENRDFVKPNGSPWASVYFLPADPVVSSLGDDGLDEYDGLLQIDLNYVRNEGRGKSREHYDILRERFKAGAAHQYGGQLVVSTGCAMNQGREVDGWYRVSVSCFFRSYVSR